MLQHGTLPLAGDLARICDALSFDSEEQRTAQKLQLRKRAVTLARAAGKSLGWSTAAAAIERGFACAFDLEMAPGQLSAAESKRAAELIDERFGNAAWTNKR